MVTRTFAAGHGERTRRPVVRGRHRARTDFRSGGGVCVPEPAEKICKGIRHAVKPFEGVVGLGGVLVESRCDRRAAAAKKSLSAVLESRSEERRVGKEV